MLWWIESDEVIKVASGRVLAESRALNFVLLTGPGPIWLYLRLAHALHGKVKKLSYSSPVTGEVVIFDHDPF